ncbi:thiamine pyrophosphate-binding protein, partial [uncultured Alistipes sp.]
MGTKAADRLVETICRAGIRRIYAVAGDSLNEVNDAVRRAGTVEWVHMRHEESGAFAASAEAQLNGIACCAGSSGPGHVHLVNGLYDAQRSNASVLAIASTCATDEFGTQYFQETEPLKLFGDCSGYCQMAATPAQLARMLPAALQYAVHRKEVAVVGLPGDVAAAEAA